MKKYKFLVIGFIAFCQHSCKKDSDLPVLPKPVNEPEVITSFKITLTDSANTSNIIVANFIDPDGDGGNQPTVLDTIKLVIHKTYYCRLQLFNDLVNSEITPEIEEEKNDHLFLFKPTAANVNIVITDFDNHTPPLPVGLASKWTTAGNSNGMVQIILKHQLGIKNGTEALGDTDVDLTFPIIIKN
jgi:hypothetical protein